ncbi:DUF3466 family protein [Photobacterium sp.]|uniref:DUF3466 family protein n=1 Tax=Photobacterium sp. TaxID=660 RepID=UPI00299F3AF0|nr:DUF3466 family protein [Photobacterium sp.]MDX1301743.1 DUF3466 family protein [Photobacterium sp.]
MQHKTLKLSTLAMLIAGATQANAAVYQVVEVDADSAVGTQEYFGQNTADTFEVYGQGITESATGENCFADGGTCNATNYKVFGESRFGTDGTNYRDEFPFLTDNYQRVNDYLSLLSYCNANLGSNTCDTWAQAQYYGKNYNRDDVNDRSGFGGLQREQAAWSRGYFANAYPLVEGSVIDTFASSPSADQSVTDLGTRIAYSSNAVVNGITGDYQYGIASSSYFKSGDRYVREFAKRGFVTTSSANIELAPATASTGTTAEKALVDKMGQTLAWDAVEYPAGQLLVVGSGSFAPSNLNDADKLPDASDVDIGKSVSSNTLAKCASEFSTSSSTLYSTYECQFSVFANDAMFWTVTPTTSGVVTGNVINKTSLTPEDPDNNDRSAQAGARAVEVIDSKPVAVGFSTIYQDSDYYAPRATVFTPKTDSVTGGWESKFIPGTEVESGGDRQFNYSVATDINKNNKVIGVAKNTRSENRSYPERIFIYDNSTNQTTFIDASVNGDIFFKGYNGFPSAINNHDQIVGWVDSETANQVDGKFRRQRGFTYMAGGDITYTDGNNNKISTVLKATKAWMLDDLTNDGAVSGDDVANQFRIAQATGINDAGVISATALMCAGGYQDLSNESQCSGDEKLVAVKLVPIPAGKIEARPEKTSSVERSGASLGLFALTMLGWIGFRRRK